METDTNQNQPDMNVHDEPLRQRIPRYVISLPERMTRAAIALVGGAVYETSNVALPRALRESKLYQVTIDRLLRIMIEWVGDVRDVYQDEETSVQELAARKFTGNVLECGQHLRRRLLAVVGAGRRVRRHGRVEGLPAGAGRRAGSGGSSPSGHGRRVLSRIC